MIEKEKILTRGDGRVYYIQSEKPHEEGRQISIIEAMEASGSPMSEVNIMSIGEWGLYNDSFNAASIVNGSHPIRLLLWAAYVARMCGAQDYTDEVIFTEFWNRTPMPVSLHQQRESMQTFPFILKSTAAKLRFFQIVGEENLKEIRKLFY